MSTTGETNSARAQFDTLRKIIANYKLYGPRIVDAMQAAYARGAADARAEEKQATIDDAMKFEYSRKSSPQTNREIWAMMADFANEFRVRQEQRGGK